MDAIVFCMAATTDHADDPKARFSNRAEDYVRYRPTYPAALFDWLSERLDAAESTESSRTRAETHIVDVGAGTGISTEPLLARGYRVTALEPNRAMRDHLSALCTRFPALSVSDASAEEMRVPPGSAHMLIAAQAFHWFDPPRFRTEAARVLVPGGGVTLVWNDRITDDSDFSEAYEALLLSDGTDYAAVSHKWAASQAAIDAFFEDAIVETAVFENEQRFDEDGLRGRARSSSYVPAEGAPGHTVFYEKLARLFRRHAIQGEVCMTYRTRVWHGIF